MIGQPTLFFPIHQYDMNETSGDMIDKGSASTKRNGTVSGATQNQTGWRGKCYSFDGSNDNVMLTGDNTFHPSSSTTGITITFWMYINGWSGADDGRIVHNGSTTTGTGGYTIYLNATNTRLECKRNNGGASYSNGILATGYWYFCCVILAANVTKFNINGVGESNTSVTTAIPTTNANNIYIGDTGLSSPNNRPFNGLIQRVRFYDKELTIQQCSQLYYGQFYENFVSRPRMVKLWNTCQSSAQTTKPHYGYGGFENVDFQYSIHTGFGQAAHVQTYASRDRFQNTWNYTPQGTLDFYFVTGTSDATADSQNTPSRWIASSDEMDGWSANCNFIFLLRNSGSNAANRWWGVYTPNAAGTARTLCQYTYALTVDSTHRARIVWDANGVNGSARKVELWLNREGLGWNRLECDDTADQTAIFATPIFGSDKKICFLNSPPTINLNRGARFSVDNPIAKDYVDLDFTEVTQAQELERPLYVGGTNVISSNRRLQIWSTCQRTTAVEAPVIGPAGDVLGAGSSFVAGKFNFGFKMSTTDNTGRMVWYNTYYTPANGQYWEMWWTPTFAYDGNPPGTSDIIGLWEYWPNNVANFGSYNVSTQQFRFSFLNSGGTATVPAYYPSGNFAADVPIHLAWTINSNGLGGTARKVEFYMNGSRVSCIDTTDETATSSNMTYRPNIYVGNFNSAQRGCCGVIESFKMSMNYDKRSFPDMNIYEPLSIYDRAA